MNCQSISPSFSASDRAAEIARVHTIPTITLRLVLRPREENGSWQLDGKHGREAALVTARPTSPRESM